MKQQQPDEMLSILEGMGFDVSIKGESFYVPIRQSDHNLLNAQLDKYGWKANRDNKFIKIEEQ